MAKDSFRKKSHKDNIFNIESFDVLPPQSWTTTNEKNYSCDKIVVRDNYNIVSDGEIVCEHDINRKTKFVMIKSKLFITGLDLVLEKYNCILSTINIDG